MIKTSKILFITKHFPPSLGGTETYNKNLLEYLASKENIWVDVITFQNSADHFFNDVSFGEKINITRLKTALPDESFVPKVLAMPVLSRAAKDKIEIIIAVAVHLQSFLVLVGYCFGYLRKNQVNVIYGVGGLYACTAGVLLSKIFSIKAVAHLHANFLFETKPSWICRLVVFILSQCKHIFTNSRDIKDDLTKIGLQPEKISIVHNWINDKIFNPGSQITARRKLCLPQNKFLIIYATRLSIDKQISLFLAAAKVVLQKNSDCRFIVIGYGFYEGQVKKAAAELSGLSYLGPKENKDLPDYLRAADLCWGVSDLTYLGLNSIESLACGTPIILPNHVHPAFGLEKSRQKISLKTLPKEIGFLVENTPKAISDKILSLAKNRKRLQLMKSGCLKFIRCNYGFRGAETVYRILISC